VRDVFQTAFSREVSVRYLPGRRIGRYRVRRLLGTGAFASVYLAWDDQLQREVAIKVPHATQLVDARSRQRFLDEARAVARVKHPRIVAIHDAAELADGTVYLVMQYVAGPSLRQRMDRGSITPAEACGLVADVAEAVDAAHRRGVIHRDLKPSNILLDEAGRPHVCDFGLALAESGQRERRGEYAGTLAYMAPEQLRGAAHLLDGRADIWAAGVILYELLSGRLPFHGGDREELADDLAQRDPRPPRQLAAGIGRSIERVCLRCLEKRPAHRYATAADLAEDLRRALAAPRTTRRALAVTAAGLALLLLAAGAAFLLARSFRPAAAPALPLRGQIELLVWNPAQAFRQGVLLSDEQAVPLRPGDRVRLAVELNQPAYAYVVWIDAEGVVAPVYPWQLGDWRQLPSSLPAADTFALPQEATAGWPIRITRNGMETLLLLARRTPLPAEVSLATVLAELPQVTIAPRAHVVRFHDGHLLPHLPKPRPPSVTRDPILNQPVAIQDPLLQLQRDLHQRLRPHFELIRAVSFPVRGD
jgi:tRNA A-37 threonylcarbamoyl transferase component Bud32